MRGCKYSAKERSRGAGITARSYDFDGRVGIARVTDFGTFNSDAIFICKLVGFLGGKAFL